MGGCGEEAVLIILCMTLQPRNQSRIKTSVFRTFLFAEFYLLLFIAFI